jgi:MSHA pilin protein MshD
MFINQPGSRQSGISLIELIMFIVIVSIALAGILLGMNQITMHSADTMLRKQALTAAESLLEEIEAQAFSEIASSPVTQGVSRTGFHNVMDYNNFNTTGIYAIDGTPVAGLNGYALTTTVVPTALGNISATSSVLLTVTVTDPMGEAIVASGYRTNH